MSPITSSIDAASRNNGGRITGTRSRPSYNVPLKLFVLISICVTSMISTNIFQILRHSTTTTTTISGTTTTTTGGSNHHNNKVDDGDVIVVVDAPTTLLDSIHNNDNNVDKKLAKNATSTSLSCEDIIDNYYYYYHNSPTWLQSARHSNSNRKDDLLLFPDNNSDSNKNKGTDGNIFEQLLQSTICYKESDFVTNYLKQKGNINIHDDNNFTTKTVLSQEQEQLTLQQWERQWMIRLYYLGIYIHQHQPAKIEYQHRQNVLLQGRQTAQQCDGDESNNSINNTHATLLLHSNDYECTNETKYVMSFLGNTGFGSVVRLGAVQDLLGSIAINRILIYLPSPSLNSKLTKKQKRQQQWYLVNGNDVECDGRNDYQCYFQPLTPCVPTMDEIMNIPRSSNKASVVQLNPTSTAYFHQHGELENAKEYEKYKILQVHGGLYKPHVGVAALQKIVHRLQGYVQEYFDNIETYKNILQDGGKELVRPPQYLIDRMTQDVPRNDRVGSVGLGGISKSDGNNQPLLRYAALLYITRPNKRFRTKIDEIVNDILSQNNIHRRRRMQQQQQRDESNKNKSTSSKSSRRLRRTYGVPIRASDKCHGESTCLLFEDYMELLFDMRNRYSNSNSNSSKSAGRDDNRSSQPLLSKFMMSNIFHDVNVSYPIHYYRNVTSKRTGITSTIAMTSFIPYHSRLNNGKNGSSHDSIRNTITPGQQQQVQSFDIDNVILTSESPSVMRLRHLFENRSVDEFPFEFVVNVKDVMQGGGYYTEFTPEKQKEKQQKKQQQEQGQLHDGNSSSYNIFTTYDVMLHTFVALKLQLASDHLVVNRCSHMHKLMYDLMDSGCGLQPTTTTNTRLQASYEYMQDINFGDNPTKYHLCCFFSQKSDEFCNKQGKEYIQRRDALGWNRFFE